MATQIAGGEAPTGRWLIAEAAAVRYGTSQVTQETRTVLATPVVKHQADKPLLLRVGQDYLRKVMRERSMTVTALARQLGLSRKHLSNILNGSAPLIEPLMGRICRALGISPSFLIALTHAGPWPEPAPHGFLRGSVEILGDPTDPMEGWEVLEE